MIDNNMPPRVDPFECSHCLQMFISGLKRWRGPFYLGRVDDPNYGRMHVTLIGGYLCTPCWTKLKDEGSLICERYGKTYELLAEMA